MWRCPPASGTPFITRPRAKKKPRGPTEESRPKQNLLVHPRPPPHRQVNAILPAASSTLERASELIDAKVYGPWVCLHIPKMATALEGNGLGGAEALSPLFDFGSRFVECDLKRRHARLSHNLLHQFFIG